MEIVTVGEVLPSWGQARSIPLLGMVTFVTYFALSQAIVSEWSARAPGYSYLRRLPHQARHAQGQLLELKAKCPVTTDICYLCHTLQFLYHHVMERSSVVSCTEARISDLASSQAHSKNWRKGPGIHCSSMRLISVQGSHEIVQGCVKWRPVSWLWL